MSDELVGDRPIVTVQVIDVVETASRLGMDLEALSGRPTPPNDFRFSMATPTGGEVTFGRGTTAAEIAAYCEREGWLA